MISRSDLINRPNYAQPLSTYKGVANMPSVNGFDSMDIKGLFLYSENQKSLAASLLKTIERNNIHSLDNIHSDMHSLNDIRKMIPEFQKRFMQNTDISKYHLAEESAVNQVDWVELLKMINADFLGYCRNYFKWNEFFPAREYATVGATGERIKKRFDQLTADDIPTLDLWADQQISVSDNRKWLNNKVPVWRTSLHSRNIDREGGGLRMANPDRASLETPIFNYNMGNIYNTISKWKESEW
jgi:hypothetical protein